MIGEVLLVPFTMGLMGSGHCVAMCGGIVGALSVNTEGRATGRYSLLLAAYNLGRILSYTLMGCVAGGLGDVFSVGLQPFGIPLLRWIAALLIVFLGLYLMGIPQLLLPLEKVGLIVWRRIQPLSKRLIPVTKVRQGVLLGFVWGWLPCGLVYTVLTYSIAQEGVYNGGLAMLAFGLGTMPALLVGGLAGKNLSAMLKHPKLRAVCGIFMLGFGVWSMWPLLHGSHGDHGSADGGAATHQHH